MLGSRPVTETELRTMRESWAVLTRQVCGVVYSGLDIALKSAWAEAEISQQNTEEAPLPLIMVTAVTVQHCTASIMGTRQHSVVAT